MFGHDYFYEDTSALQHLPRQPDLGRSPGSASGSTTSTARRRDASDDTIVSTTIRNTALGYIYSRLVGALLARGRRGHRRQAVRHALDTWVPDYDLVVVILNEPGFGGCGGGGFQIVTLGSSWAVMAHEFGHGTGGLADEYCAKPGTYTGGEPGAPNVTTNTNRATLKWRQFVNPATPVPTGTGRLRRLQRRTRAEAGRLDGSQTTSACSRAAVPGRAASTARSINCRMRGNSPPYCPVCYTRDEDRTHEPYAQHTLPRTSTPATSTATARTTSSSTTGTRSTSTARTARSSTSCSARSSGCRGRGSSQPGDQFYVGDFNGDGKDEVVVFNGTNWAMEYLGPARRRRQRTASG